MSTQTYINEEYKMEAPKEELEIFSSILLQEYVRLMTVAAYIKHENNLSGVKFAISKENYDKMMAEPLQTALIGLDLKFTADVLTVVPNNELLQQYENKIMKEVVQIYWDNYKNRYAKFIKIIEENN